jgi:CxxC motif-containing protein
MRELVCIGCPMGCRLLVDTDGQTIRSVSGHLCRLGKTYAADEVLHARRMLTGLIAVPGSLVPLSVRTRSPIPKDLIWQGLRAMHEIRIQLPVHLGDVLQADFLGTGIDLIATRDLPENEPDL